MNRPAIGHINAGTLAQIKERGCTVVTGGGHAIAVFFHDGQVHAVDNRCPHMGFPLERGSVRDGILTCHWHHARFELSSGGTFNPFADDVRTFPVKVADGKVWIDPAPAPRDEGKHWRAAAGRRHGAQPAIGHSQGGAGPAGRRLRLPGTAADRRPVRHHLFGQWVGRSHDHHDLHRQHAAAVARGGPVQGLVPGLAPRRPGMRWQASPLLGGPVAHRGDPPGGFQRLVPQFYKRQG